MKTNNDILMVIIVALITLSITVLFFCILWNLITDMILQLKLDASMKKHNLFKKCLLGEIDVRKRVDLIINKYDRNDWFFTDAIITCVIPYVPTSEYDIFASLVNEDMIGEYKSHK